jgi:hypothetical protein
MLSKLVWLVLYFLVVSLFEWLLVSYELRELFFVATVVFTLVFLSGAHRAGWLRLDDRDLFSQPLFLISILLPIYYFAAIGLWVWKGHGLDFSSNGFANFLEISKLPLLFLASAIPMAAIVNNVHRTIQTEKQIRESEKKNLSDAYYGHLKFMVDQFKTVEGFEVDLEFVYGTKPTKALIQSKINVRFPLELYRRSFHLSSPESGADSRISEDFLKDVRGEWDAIIKNLTRLRNKDSIRTNYPGLYVSEVVSIYAGIDLAHQRLCSLLCLNGFHSKNTFLMQDWGTVYKYGSTFCNPQHMLESLRSLEHVTLLLLEKMYNETVKSSFDIDKPIFTVGDELSESWSRFLTLISVKDYSGVEFTTLGPTQHSTLTTV